MLYEPRQVDVLPESSGIYAIINRTNGERYVGQAVNIRYRLREHLRQLDAGIHKTNEQRLLQRAWDRYGRDAFAIEVLELVADNRHKTIYAVRPDNLSLAEHHYINERAELNVDRAIVEPRHAQLIRRRAWRETGLDDDTLQRLRSAVPYVYAVTRRGQASDAVIVSAFNEREAKHRAAAASETLRGLGANVSARRIGGARALEMIASGAMDARA